MVDGKDTLQHYAQREEVVHCPFVIQTKYQA